MIRTIFSFGTLKFRITAVVIFLVLLAAGLVAYVSLHLAERQMRSVVGDQQFALLSSAASYIDEDLGAKTTLLMGLREQITHAKYRAPAAIQEFLEAHSTLRDEFFNVIALDDTGMVVANLNDRRLIGTANFSKRPYFADTINRREGLISAPFKSTLSGKPVVLVTEPVFDDAGKLIYILGGSIDLQRPRFFGQLEALKPGRSGYLFMLTSDGTMIHHPDRARILKNVNAEAGGPVAATRAAMNGFEGWVEGETKRGVNALIAYKRLRKTDWIIGAVYPVNEAFSPLIDMRKHALFASGAVALAFGVLGWLAILKLLRPLGALQRHVAAISDGSENIDVFDVVRQDEFGELSRAFFVLSQQRRLAENNLVTLARTDPLTGIHNRRMFEEVFKVALGRADRNQRYLALAYLDIDRFKHINDTHGHGIGDQVLVEFARRLTAAVRTTDSVSRLAGDEFVVIFESLSGDVEAATLAEKILGSIRPPFVVGDLALTVTTSIGIAFNSNGNASAAEFMEASDQALYEAKTAGRNGYAVRQISNQQGVRPSASRAV